MTLELDFNIKDRVEIEDLNTKGKVKSIWITETGVKYEIRYFMNGSVKEDYFYADELRV